MHIHTYPGIIRHIQEWRRGHEYLYTFVNIYAFILENNFHFFEHANELINVQIHQTSFIKFVMILDLFLIYSDSLLELLFINSVLQIMVSVFEKNCSKVIFSRVAC